jgi:hypothetical protein
MASLLALSMMGWHHLVLRRQQSRLCGIAVSSPEDAGGAETSTKGASIDH